MIIRIGLIGLATLAFSSSAAQAQGRPTQKVVLSEAVVKSLGANKPKSKTPVGGRVGVVRKSSAVGTTGKAAPTWVKEIKPVSKKK